MNAPPGHVSLATAAPPSRRSRLDLLWSLSRADLTSRFRATSLGVLWSALNPAFTGLVLFVVFGRVVRLGIPDYPLFVLAGLVPWSFCSGGVTYAAAAPARHRPLVKQIRIPRALLVLAGVLASLPSLLIGLALVAGLALALGFDLAPWLCWLPAALCAEIALVVGLGLIAAAGTTLFRDLDHLMAAGIRAAFFLSPILYPLERVPEAWRPLYLVNPVAGILELYRAPLLSGAPPSFAILLSAFVPSLAFLVAGWILFHRLEPDLDDHL